MSTTIRIVNKSGHPLPTHATTGSAGLDLRAALEEPVTLEPLDRALIPTGLYFAIPAGYEVQIRPRSGLAMKHGITVLNTPGTIDSDYRGEIRVALINLSREPFTIEPGERICQMVLSRYEQVEWVETDQLDDTDRGEGGFGHTGRN